MWRQGLDGVLQMCLKRHDCNSEDIVAIEDVNGRLITDFIEKANALYFY
jgi:hypothetical protein